MSALMCTACVSVSLHVCIKRYKHTRFHPSPHLRERGLHSKRSGNWNTASLCFILFYSHTHTHTHTHTHSLTHTHIHSLTHTYTYTHSHTHMHIHSLTHTC